MYEMVAKLEDLQKAFKLRIMLENTPILLLYFEGKVYAINDKCPHLGISLNTGSYDVETGKVTCRAHGAKIDVKTGDIDEKAHIAFFKLPTKKAKSYETKVENGLIYVKK